MQNMSMQQIATAQRRALIFSIVWAVLFMTIAGVAVLSWSRPAFRKSQLLSELLDNDVAYGLGQGQQVQYVSFREAIPDLAHFSLLAKEVSSIRFRDISLEEINGLLASQHWVRLQELIIHGADLSQSLELGKADACIEWLVLVDCFVSDGFFDGASSGSLQVVKLAECRLSPKAISRFSEFTQLNSVYLTDVTGITSNGMRSLGRLGCLRSLSVIGGEFDGSEFAEWPQVSSLSELVLKRTKFGDDQCRYLSRFPNLKRLDLAETRVSDVGVVHLKGLANIEYISVEGTEVTKGSMAVFETMPQLKDVVW